MNPSWLLESSQHCWLSPTLEDRQRSSPAAVEERSSLSSPWEESDSWTEREKSLLEKGIELFGRSWTRVSQFVGTKTPLQSKSQASLMGISSTSRISESSEHEEEAIQAAPPTISEVNVEQKQTASFNYTEIYDDMAIPASIEEVISVVTTAQPTVLDTSASPPKKKKRLLINETPKASAAKQKLTREKTRPPKSIDRSKKFETISAVEELDLPKLKLDEVSQDVDREVVEALETFDASFEENKHTGPVIFVSEGEELVRIQKASDDSDDSEIDIDDGDNTCDVKKLILKEESEPEAVVSNKVLQPEVDCKVEEVAFAELEEEKVGKEKIFTFPLPLQEVSLDPEIVTDQEKDVHFEFFTGRPTKTPSRYLKIRNHIIDMWKECKPNYVSKTQTRNGLKNCGDVNAIGRIHAYLEQIGVINFGCEQVLYKPIVIPTGTKKSVSVSKIRLESKPLSLRSDGGRPRKKRTEQLDSDGEGGYTITHDEHGSAILTKVYREQSPKTSKSKKSSQNEHHRLVYCHKFSDIHKAPFSVILDIGALLLMDVHSHSSKSEVIGLLGGCFDARTKKLHISRAVACKSQSTGVQCDMCPISQTEASETIQYAGLEVVGWYHSHPTFLPNPSVQDMETQVRVQNWFEKTEAPFIGIIVAPYYSANKTLASNYKCLIMQDEGGETKPYQFPVQVSPSQSYSESLLGRIEDVFLQMDHDQGSAIVPFDEEVFPNSSVSYLEKVVESARLHIDRCHPALSIDQRSALISGIIDLCERNTKPKTELF
ncbi:histone H2A deubiquitinase MYSM1-like isoform X2 [Neocloeon triangulifer]|nr:histone H2A deubiquitinase MYSM1-like isoform X2 [Neocloeon triangulifer]